MRTGLVVLVSSTIVIGYGNYLARDPSLIATRPPDGPSAVLADKDTR